MAAQFVAFARSAVADLFLAWNDDFFTEEPFNRPEMAPIPPPPPPGMAMAP